MQKKLLAAAVAAAFVAPAAALAQSTSTVNIYGNMTYEYAFTGNANGRPNADGSDTPGGSAIGFRGEEKLGGNMSAWFQCESSADIRGMDQAGWCTRNSAVGFKGGFGNIFFGRWDTPFKRVMNVGTVGAEETGILGMSFMAFGGSGGSDATQNVAGATNHGGESYNRVRFKRRETGLSYYESPSFGGFQVLAAVSSGQGAIDNGATDGTNNGAARVWSIGGIYSAGPLGIGFGYEKHVNFGAFNAAGDPPDVDDRGWGASIAYTFGGRVKVGGTFLDRKFETFPGFDVKQKTWTIGVDWAIAGPHSLEAQYTFADDVEGNSPVGVGGGAASFTGGAVNPNRGVPRPGPDTGGQAFSIAYKYSFSKRTSIKFAYVRVENDGGTSSYNLGNLASNTGVGALGATVDAIGMHIRHRF